MQLRAVGPDEAPVVLSVADAARTGDRRLLLAAMRDRIAEAITDGCAPRDLAALTKRLGDIDRELRALDDAAREEERAAAAVAGSQYDPEAI